MSGAFLIPGVVQNADLRVAKVQPAVLEKLAPALGVLLPSCVPSPFAEAEVMAQILPAIGPATPDVTPQYPREQHQNFANWQLLVKALLLGRVFVENVPLGTADNFGVALMQSRTRKSFQGVIRCDAIPGLVPPDRKSRVVGGLDEFAFVWSAPRMYPEHWGELKQRVTGADNTVALDLLHAWRAMLVAKKLWPDEDNEQPWNHGVNLMLDGYKPTTNWEQLQPNVRMAGPVRLMFSANPQKPQFIDVYLPVFSPGYVSEFQKIFQLCPADADGGENLVDESAPDRIGSFVQLSANPRRVNADGTPAASVQVAPADALLGGLGSVTTVDRYVSGTRWWLQDREGRKGYHTAVYLPLLQQVLSIQGACVPLGEADIESCPILFPDALRVPWRQLNPPPGTSVVDCDYLRGDRLRELTRQWPLPEYGLRVSEDIAAPSDSAFVVALESGPSSPCLIERLDRGDGTFIEVGEVRALGALLWELFIGEAEFSPAPSIAIVYSKISAAKPGEKVASQWREAEPRMEFKDELLSAVGSQLSRRGLNSDAYRRDVRRRRATAQRLFTLWRQAAVPGVDGWLGSLAVRAFLEWVFDDPTLPLEAWGAVPDRERVPERRLQVTRTVAVPVFTDVYPRKV